MRKMAVSSILALAVASIFILGCEQTTPTPEVEVVDVDPATVWVSQDDTIGPTVTVYLESTNSVDAMVTDVRYVYFDENGDLLVQVEQVAIKVSIFVSGARGSQTRVDLNVPIAKVVDYMYTHNQTAASVEIWIGGEDSYGYEKEFWTTCTMSVARFP